MERTRRLASLVMMSCILLPGAALAQTAKGTDQALDSRIERRIHASPTLRDDQIQVAVDNGVVTLTGRALSAAHSARAEALARVRGVTRVDNRIKIDPSLAHRAPRDGHDADAEDEKGAVAATKDAAGTVADAVTDAWIITKLHAEFLNEAALKDSRIHVRSDHHIVTLRGTVVSAAGRARAVQLAKTTKGVAQVVDTLTIGPKR